MFVALLSLLACAAEIKDRGAHEDEQEDREDEIAARDPENGADLYPDNCAGCHGASGTGGAGPAMSEVAAALTDDEIESAITDGTEGGMPPFGDLLTDDEIGDLVAYIRQSF